ncbi:MAG: DUF4040 domain-containing protein [Loktanella sp.]|nr:DUF4040 domain-containing protein [Loktanella sp.]
MPVTAFAAVLAGLSMAGIPPLLGFIAKELSYAGSVEAASSPFFVAGAFLIASALMFAIAAIVAYRPFFSKAGKPLENITEARWPMLAGPLTLAVLGAFFGLFPSLLQNSLIHPTVASIMGTTADAKTLQLWAGFNLPLVLSVLTFVLGYLIYANTDMLRARLVDIIARSPNFDRGWDKLLAGVLAGAKWQTRVIQTGQLRFYIVVTFVTALAAMAITLVVKQAFVLPIIWTGLEMTDWLVFGLVLFGTGLTIWTQSRITAIAGLGVVGIAVAMIYILYSAPDVAITQLLVETLTVVLFAAAALRLPSLGAEPLNKRWGDAAIAIGMGVTVTMILLMATSGPIDRSLSDFFEAASYPEAFGQNIVNVVLVDFRALDTFGEIAVVLVAAIGIYALLRSKPEKDEA